MAKLGDVEFNVLTESRPHNNKVTSHPVEKGSDITDHVKREQLVYDITGVVGDSEDPGDKHLKLKYMWARGDIVDYKGRSTLNNCVVEDFTSDVDEGTKKGFNFSLTLRQVRISEPSTVSKLNVNLKVDKKAIGDAGRVQAK